MNFLRVRLDWIVWRNKWIIIFPLRRFRLCCTHKREFNRNPDNDQRHFFLLFHKNCICIFLNASGPLSPLGGFTFIIMKFIVYILLNYHVEFIKTIWPQGNFHEWFTPVGEKNWLNIIEHF